MAKIITLPNGDIQLQDTWDFEDVNNVQDSRNGDTLSNEQCKQVLELLSYWYDANEGVNWNLVEDAIDQILEENKA